MLRRCLSATVVMFLVAGLILAAEYRGTLTAIEDGQVKITVREKGKKGKGEEKTFKLAKTAKFVKKGKDAETDIEDGAKGVTKMISESKGKTKGVPVTITTEGEGDKERVTKITVTAGGKRKKKKDAE
jgi:hypothetical protein